MKIASKELINLALDLSHKSHDADINCIIVLGNNIFLNGELLDNLEAITNVNKRIVKLMRGKDEN